MMNAIAVQNYRVVKDGASTEVTGQLNLDYIGFNAVFHHLTQVY